MLHFVLLTCTFISYANAFDLGSPCSPSGSFYCSQGRFQQCNQGQWAEMQNLADGTDCLDYAFYPLASAAPSYDTTYDTTLVSSALYTQSPAFLNTSTPTPISSPGNSTNKPQMVAYWVSLITNRPDGKIKRHVLSCANRKPGSLKSYSCISALRC